MVKNPGRVTTQKGKNPITKRKATVYLTLKKMNISQNCWVNKLIVTAKMKKRIADM